MRVPNAYCALGCCCCAAGADRLIGDAHSLAGTGLLGTPVEPALLRSLLTGEPALGTPVIILLLLLGPAPDSTGRAYPLLLLLLTAAAAASGLAGIMLAPCELSRIEDRAERRRMGVVVLLAPLPVGPFGLALLRRGGAAGGSGGANGAQPPGSCCLPPAATAAAGLRGLAPAGWLYTALRRLMYFDCLSALGAVSPSAWWLGAASAVWA
jgi:hypothetical protein